MDRKALAKFTHCSDNFLSLENNNYKQWVFKYTFLELEKDLAPSGDLSTTLLFGEGDFNVKAKIVAKSSGILAGIREIKYFLTESDPNFKPRLRGKFMIDFNLNDGDKVLVGDTIMEISANVHDVLAVERTILNLLMRMSSVATNTSKFVEVVRDYNVLLAPTRKTLWGLLDKKAVFVGGGGTHRLNLSDAVILKDTHLDILDRDFEDVFKRIIKGPNDFRFLEIEVSSIEESIDVARRFSEAFSVNKIESVGVVMFDNMNPSSISNELSELKKLDLYDNILFEASGGISKENLLEYAKTGVDIISLGALTSGISSFDMSLKVLK
jgi:nicotinate-nucleotide pyrophosphorylase (carboxylating)